MPNARPRPIAEKPQALPQPTAGAPAALTPEDLGPFLDGIVPFELKRENIAGAVVMVVKDGKVLYTHGYGYADVAKKTPVTPDTLFRPGSISKLFTWTAVMQLVQAGKIDLHANINQYLDFKVPATYPQPITMWNLMTHTPGFEEAIKDLIDNEPKPMPLRQYLVNHMPDRVYPPGTIPAYSNYGATLAGYIVQRVSGMPFDDYVEKNIFQPLGMTHTTFVQPLPAALQPFMSQGYALATSPPKPYETIAAEPAGSSATSANDISHFMIAHLQGGEYNGVSILSPATVAQMHSAQFAADPSLPHMALGFYEETRNGHRIIGHGGDTQWFHSDLHLIQDENLGFFVSYNSVGRGEIDARGELFHAFLNRYFPYRIPPAAKQPNAVRDAQSVAGEYITSRRPVTNILSFFGFLSNLSVIPNKDGTITVSEFKSMNQVPKTFVEIGPLLYREKNGQDLVGFTRDYQNRLTLSMDYPFMVWTKVGLANNKNWNFFLLGLIVTVCIGTLLWWPLSIWVRRHYHHPLELNGPEPALRRLIRLVLAADLAFLLCWTVLLISSGGNPLLNSSLDGRLRLFQVIGWIGSLGTLLVIYGVARLWRARGEWWVSRVGNLLIALAAISFSWFLLHWHMLHFSLRY
ncbi:MAG: serine hydrolase [Acidobacteriaceae bacterium]